MRVAALERVGSARTIDSPPCTNDAIPCEIGRHDETTQPLDTSVDAASTLVALERLARGLAQRTVVVADRYRIERCLGCGGTAMVFAAHDLNLDRPVALKVLSRQFIENPEVLTRFIREARYVASLRHPNIVDILDFDASTPGLVVLSMELLDGEDLRRTLARAGRLPWARVLPIMLDICAGLEAAHASGIVHRDLKPANCFVVEWAGRELVRLVDFGIATETVSQAPAPPRERLTEEQIIVGTPHYMSPEQARGQLVDHRTDIYAAGVILGELLTGRVPFDEQTTTATLAAHMYEAPPRLAELAPAGVVIPPALEAIYARALAKQPDQRYASIHEFAQALCEVDTPAELEPNRMRDVSGWLRARAGELLMFVLGALAGIGATSWAQPEPSVTDEAEVGCEPDP